MTKFKTAVAAVLALAGALTATVAAARPAAATSDTTRIVVRYGDLNLATREGADALRSRILHAAMRIKGDVDPRDLQGMAELRRAREAALGMADAIIAHSQSAYAAAGSAPGRLDL